MQLLVTGGNGFVMSHLVRQWLERGAAYRAISVDLFEPDAQLRRFLGPLAERVEFLTVSVADASVWEVEMGALEPDYFVHGAAMTPNRGRSERDQARTVVEVNIQGVLNALEWARNRVSLRRIVHVSTGSVYGADGPDGALPEDGYELRSPDSLYPLTKRAGELLALRYRELFDLPLAVCRLSSIYGPMDRRTPGRDFVCVPNLVVQRALHGDMLRIYGADAIGDWLHAADVASGILALLDSGPLDHAIFNLSYGEAASIRELADFVAEIVPGARWMESTADQADIVADPGRRHGAWGAYDNSRLRALGWSPTPLRDALADYIDWARHEELAAGGAA